MSTLETLHDLHMDFEAALREEGKSYRRNTLIPACREVGLCYAWDKGSKIFTFWPKDQPRHRADFLIQTVEDARERSPRIIDIVCVLEAQAAGAVFATFVDNVGPNDLVPEKEPVAIVTFEQVKSKLDRILSLLAADGYTRPRDHVDLVDEIHGLEAFLEAVDHNSRRVQLQEDKESIIFRNFDEHTHRLLRVAGLIGGTDE